MRHRGQRLLVRHGDGLDAGVGLVGIAGASVWLLMFPPANDAFVSTEQWVSVAWLALAPLSAAIPAIWTTRRRDR